MVVSVLYLCVLLGNVSLFLCQVPFSFLLFVLWSDGLSCPDCVHPFSVTSGVDIQLRFLSPGANLSGGVKLSPVCPPLCIVKSILNLNPFYCWSFPSFTLHFFLAVLFLERVIFFDTFMSL